MPLDRFVLILIAVFAAAAVTVAIGAWAMAALQLPGFALAVAAPFLLIAYVIVRVITDRVRDKEDDHYDRIDP